MCDSKQRIFRPMLKKKCLHWESGPGGPRWAVAALFFAFHSTRREASCSHNWQQPCMRALQRGGRARAPQRPYTVSGCTATPPAGRATRSFRRQSAACKGGLGLEAARPAGSCLRRQIDDFPEDSVKPFTAQSRRCVRTSPFGEHPGY